MHPQYKPPNATCLHCAAPFYVRPSRIAQGFGKFCSKACYDIYQTRPHPELRTRIGRICETCGATFLTKVRTRCSPQLLVLPVPLPRSEGQSLPSRRC